MSFTTLRWCLHFKTLTYFLPYGAVVCPRITYTEYLAFYQRRVQSLGRRTAAYERSFFCSTYLLTYLRFVNL